MHDSAAPRKALSPASHERFAFAAMLAGNVCLAFGPWFVRLAGDGPAGIGPVASSFWRLALAAPILLLLSWPDRQAASRLSGGLWGALAIGGLFFAADLAAWHAGIFHTRLANATLFGNSSSFLYAAYGFLLARQLPGRNQSLALILAALGTALLLGRSYELSSRYLLGDLLCMLAGFLYTGYLVALGRARAQLPPILSLAVSTGAGMAPLLLLAWTMGERIVPGDWTAVLLLAVGSQVLGQGFMIYALGHLSPVIFGLGLLTQPVVGATIGWLVYGERLSVLDLVGAAIIGAALVLMRRPDRLTRSDRPG